MRVPRSLLFVAAGCSALVLAACEEEKPAPQPPPPEPECIADAECGVGMRCDTATQTCTECPPEIPYDGLDNDCDPSSRDLDVDGDGENADDSPLQPGRDCDDTDPTVHPDLEEACGDGRDNDCDLSIDEFCVDAEDPIVSISSPSDGAVLAADFDFTALATDDFGVKSVQLFIDDQSLGLFDAQPYGREVLVATLTEGPHRLAAVVTDTSPGAGKTARAEIGVIVDTRSPVVTLVRPGRDEIRGGDMTVEVTATDGAGVATVEVLSDGVAIATATAEPWQLVIDTRALVDGPSTLTVRATDTGGAATTLPLPITIDNTPPALTWLAPLAGSAHATNVLAQVEATDAVRLVSIDLEGSIAASSPAQLLVDLSATPEGVRTLTATARDAAILDDVPDVGNRTTVTLDVVVDRTPPTVAIVQPAAGATVSDTVALEADATDAAGVVSVSWLDDLGGFGAPIPGPGPRFPIAWDSNRVVNGPAIVRARAIDTAGNEAIATLDVVVDNAPPAVTVVRPLAGELRGGLMTVEATVIEGAGVERVEFGVDGNVLLTLLAPPFIGTIDTRSLADGPHDLRVESFDITARSTAVIRPFVADNTAPAVAFATPVEGSSHAGVVACEVTASDAIGLVEIALEGTTSAVSPLLLSFDGPGQPEGPRALVATARDGAIVDDVPGGNVGTATLGIVIDRTAPALTLDSPLAGATLSDVVSLLATATDAVGVVQVEFTDELGSVGGPLPGPGPGFATGWDTTRLGDGTRRITARATDAAGNFTEAFADVTIDNAPPAIAIVRPLAAERRGGLATFEATSSDPGGITRVELDVDGVVLAAPLAPPFLLPVDTRTLADGPHVLTARAFDTSARSASTSVTIEVDNTAPVVAFTAPLAGAIRSATVPVTVTATDPAGLVSIDAEGTSGATSPLSFSLAIGAVPDGALTLSATAEDATIVDDGASPGNVGAASVSIQVDNTPPLVAIVTPLAGANLRATVPVEATASDAVGIATVQLRAAGVALGGPIAAPGPYAQSWVTTTTPNGSKVIRAEAVDLAGNLAAAELTVAVDNTAPTACALTAPAANERVNRDVTISGTGTDVVGIDHIDYLVDGVLLATGAGSPSSVSWNTRGLSAGAHTVGAVCYDASGNSRASATRTVTVDNDPPILAITAPLAGEGVFRSTLLTATATDAAGVTSVEFRVNGTLVGTDLTSPYSVTYDFTYDSGSATIRADAIDSEGNPSTTSTVVTVVPRANFRVAELYDPVGAIGTSGFAVADVTQDGLPDVVTGGASVSILRGGPKHLLPATQIAGLSTVVATQLVDADRDGDLDLLALRASSFDVQLRAADGSFSPPVSIALGAIQASSFAAADLDGDADLDVVVGRGTAGADVLIFTNVAGAYALASTAGTGGSVTDVELADVDADGDRDILVGRSGAGNEKLTVFRNTGSGSFLGGQDSVLTPTVPVAPPDKLVSGDFDGDGLLEVIAVLPAAATLQRLEASSPGNFTVLGNISTEATPNGIAAGDLDGDGDLDLVVTAGGANALEIFTNVGGTFTSNQALFVGRGVRHPALSDLDADGDLDVVVSLSTEASVGVIRNQGALSFVAAAALRTSLAGVRRTPRAIALGALSGSGLEDLAVTFDAAAPALQAVAVFEAQGPASFTVAESRDLRASGGACMAVGDCPASWTCAGAIAAPPTPGVCTSSVMSVASALAIGDADGVAPADLAVGSTGGVGVVAAFLPRTAAGIGMDEVRNEVSPSSVTFGDTDGDGLDELFFSVDPGGAATDGVLEWNVALRTAGTRRFTGAGPKSVIVGDTDGDGDRDLAVACSVTDNIAVFPAVGGVLGAATNYSAMNGIAAIGLGRVAGDALVDMLGIGGTQVVLMPGAAGGFLSPSVWPAGTSPSRLAVGDFNGDGLDDVATLNGTLDRVVVLHGRPQGGFFGPDEFPLGPGLFDLARGDLDRDGSPDLAVSSTTGRAVGLLYNDVDKGAPLMTVLRPMPGELRGGLMTVEATLVDASGIDRLEVSVDGVVLQTLVAAPWVAVIDTTTLSAGPHSLRLEAFDLTANSIVQVIGFDVDNTPPSVAFQTPVDGGGVAGQAPIRIAASDESQLASIEFGAASSPTSPLLTTLDTTALPEGSLTLTATARDAAIRDDLPGGNVATTSITVFIDRATPTLTIDAPLAGAVVGDLVAVQATASDGGGITSVTFADEVGVFATLPGPGPGFLTSWPSTRVPSGPATLTVTATDGSGLLTVRTVVVTVDNAPPTLSVTTPLANQRRGGLTTFEVATSDPSGVQQVAFDVDGVVLSTLFGAPWRVVVDTRTLADGPHTFRATSTDVTNRSSVATVAISVDNTPPSLSFTSPAPGEHRSAFVDVSINASDASGITSFTSEGNSSATSPLAYRLSLAASPDGPRTLSATARDGAIVDDGAIAGNAATVTRAITVDNTPPTVALTAPAAGAALRGTVGVSATASDAIGVTQVQLRGAGVALGAPIPSPGPYTASWNTVATPNGTRIVRAEASDAAGNVGVAEITVTVDNAVPTDCDITTPAPTERVSGNVTFAANGVDAVGVSSIQLRVDGAPLVTLPGASVTTSWNTLLATPGVHALTAVCFDAAGNSRTSASRNVTVDNDPPSVAITSPLAGAGVFRATTISATAGDIAGINRVEFRVNGALVGSDTSTPYATTYDFTHATGVATIRADAFDNEGNVASTSVAVSVVPRAGFRVAEILTPAAPLGSQGLSVGDVTTDGRRDIITGGTPTLFRAEAGWFAPGVELEPLALVAANALGDLDGDGDLDLVSVRTTAVEVQLGAGDGTFAPPTTVTLGAGVVATSVALGDLDGDGDLDAAVGRSAAGGDAITLFNVGGALSVGATYGTGGNVTDILLVDVDADGDRDIAVGRVGLGNSKLTIFLNTGNGVFLSGQDSLTLAPPERIVAGDFDGDGVIEIAASMSDVATVEVLEATATAGNFVSRRTLTTERGPTGLAAGDLDGDGDLDLAVAAGDVGALELFVNQGGAFTSNQLLFVGRAPRHVRVADLEGDGDADVVVSLATDGVVAVVRNLGGLSFVAAPALRPTDGGGTRRVPRAIAIGAVGTTGGAPDLAVTFDAPPPPAGGPQQVAVLSNFGYADFRLDGALDLVEEPGAACLTNLMCPPAWACPGGADNVDPTPDVWAVCVAPPMQRAYSLSVGNADGVPPDDVAIGTTSSVGVVGAYVPRTAAGFGTMEGLSADSVSESMASPYWSAFGDVDGDGIDELFFTVDPPNAPPAPSRDGVIRWDAGAGVPMIPPITWATGEGPRHVLVADADADGDLDLVVANNVTDNVTIFPYAGGAQGAPTTYSAVNGVVSVGFGHLAGDGILDLLAIGGTQAIVLQGAVGGFIPPTTHPAGTSPTRIQVGDYNGDGLDDIATLNATIDRLVVLIARPQGGFFPPDEFPLGPAMFDLAMGDLDGDGRPDLAVTATSVGSVGLLYNDR